jgi:hypothetical protein
LYFISLPRFSLQIRRLEPLASDVDEEVQIRRRH